MTHITNDLTILTLRKALDGAAARQGVAASNLANIETPGYRPQRIEFQAQLREALQAADRGDTTDLELLSPTHRQVSGPALRRDGNAVDVETEMAELAVSSLQYQAVTRLLSRKLQMLRSVATEGGRG